MKKLITIALILFATSMMAQKVVLLDTVWKGNRHHYEMVFGDIRTVVDNDTVKYIVLHVQKQLTVNDSSVIQKSMNVRITKEEINAAFSAFLNSNNFKTRVFLQLRNDFKKKIAENL